MRIRRRWLVYLGVGLLLALVARLYSQPDFLVQIANQVVTCF